MTAILVLLLLLSLATLVSRPGAVGPFFDRVGTPLLLALGFACTPVGLGLASYPLIESLRPALAVGVTWLAFLTGLRALAPTGSGWDRERTRALLVVSLGAVASVGLSALALLVPSGVGLETSVGAPVLFGAAVVIGGALVGSPPVESSRDDRRIARYLVQSGEWIAIASSVLAVALLPEWSALSPAVAAVVLVGGGLVLALVQRLAGGGASGDTATRTIALLGLIALAAGLLHEARLPSVVSGLIAGAALGRTTLGGLLHGALTQTERPARIVVAFLIGMIAPLSSTALLVGALLALAQALIQLVSTSWAVGHAPSLPGLVNGLSSSTTPLLLAASYDLAGLPEGRILLATVVVAVFLVDTSAGFLGLVVRVRARSGAFEVAP